MTQVHDIEGYDMRDSLNTSWDPYNQYATHLFTSKAINQIMSHNISEPMFLYLAHLAVHVGNIQKLLEAPAHTVKKFAYIRDIKRRIFAGA